MKTRKTPMRMCVGCREMKPKKELLRVVRTPEGDVAVDRTSKASGRGAYICESEDCLNRAIKTRGIERSLSVRVDEVLGAQLLREIKRSEIRKNL